MKVEIFDVKINDTEFRIIKEGRAWGDGEHESTNFMMDSICKYGVKDKVVLDIGTGTGILSVLCGKLGAKEILAVDVDDEILKCAKTNFETNGVSVSVQKNNLTHGLDFIADVILANLCFPIQHENILTISDKMHKDSLLIITWENFFNFNHFVKGFEVIEHVKGIQFDGYVLRKIV